MDDEARRELARVRAQGLEPFREALWLASLTYLTDACAVVGDEEVAELVTAELEPYAGTTVVVGHGVACYGAADRYLGMLAATLRDWEVAEMRFDAAMELNRRMGAADMGRPHGLRVRSDASRPRSHGGRGPCGLDADRGR